MRKLIVAILFLAVAGSIAWVPFHKWARTHVDWMTGVGDHPLLCTSCHLYISKNPVISRLTNAEYFSPFNMAFSGQNMLLATARDKNELLVIDAEKGKVTRRIKVGTQPHSVVVSHDGNLAYVSNQWSDNVSVVDLTTGDISATLATSGGPAGMVISKDGKALYVVNAYSSDISVIDLEHQKEINRIVAGNNPTGAGLSPEGLIFVTSRRAVIAPYGDTLRSEITVIDDLNRKITDRLDVTSAYLMENIDFTPSGDLALFTLIRPKNLIPSIQVELGFMMTHGFGIIDNDGRIFQLLTDEPNAYYSDPFDIVISHDGHKAFISNSGVNCITVVNIDSVRSLLKNTSSEMMRQFSNHLGISSRYVTARIKTGANPKGLTLSPDGKYLYVAEQLEDRIMVINTETLETERTIDLGGPRRITVARQGRRLLNNAGHTFQDQYSCYTCHPDEHEDGLVYNMASKDMGRNVTNTQSLRDIAETAPFKWNGKNQTVFKQDGIRFSTVLTRTEQFSFKNLDAITAYIMTGIKFPPNLQYNPDGELTENQLKGKEIFERDTDNFGRPIPENNRCITCHPPPYYTDLQTADVSTLAASDDSMLFDTPHLNNIYASPPYLHDGRAATLEEIWTVYGTDDKHGLMGDMTKMELNYLIEYLKSLRAPEYEKSNKADNIITAILKPKLYGRKKSE
jgi:YVTN family beta-propeller protein